jgi:phage tail tape-measure protein
VPGILKLVANEMGVTVGQLKQLGSEGKITSDVLINALAKGFEENKDKICRTACIVASATI